MKSANSPMDQISKMPNFRPFMKVVALMGGVLCLIGLLMKLVGAHGGTPLLVTGGSTLALVAFLLGWLFPYPYSVEDERYVAGVMPIWNFAMRLTGWSLAIAIMGLLFRLMHWPGGMKMLLFGGVSLAVSGIAWLFFLHLKKKSNNQ